jgi:ParB family chromosome partitioning protein
MIENKSLTMGHAKVIMNRSDILKMAKIIIEESLSVRQTEVLCADLNEELFPKEKIKSDNKIIKKEINYSEYNQRTEDLTNKLRNILGSDIKIKSQFNPDKNKGKITISYNDLDKIINIIQKLEQGEIN